MAKKKQTNIIQDILDEKRYYESATQDYRDAWYDCYKHYQFYLDPSKNPYVSKNYIPKVHDAVERLTAFLVARDPSLTVIPQGEADSDLAKFMSKLIDFQWGQTMDMKPKIQKWVKAAILFGTGISKVCWRTKTEMKKVRKEVDVNMMGEEQEPIKTTTKEKVVTYDDPHFEPVHIFDFYIDPLAPSVEAAKSVIHRTIVSISELKKNPAYKDVDKVKPQRNVYYNNTKDKDSSAITNTFDIDNTTSEPNTLDVVEVLERWTDERVVTIANPNDPVILRDAPNPYEHGMKPFVSINYKSNPFPNRFYGVGAVEQILQVQKTMNSLTNQTVDNAKLILNNMFKLRRGANINKKQTTSKPGGYIEVDDMDDVQPLPTPDLKGSAFNLYKQLDIEFQQSTGVTDLSKGMNETDTTATETIIRDRNAGAILNMFKENIEHGIKQIGELIIQLDMQYIQNTRSIRVFDTDEQKYEFVEFTGDQIRGNYDLDVKADSTLSQSKAVLQKQLLDMLRIVGSDPEMQGRINKAEVYKQWMEYAGYPEIDRYFNEEAVAPPGMMPPTPDPTEPVAEASAPKTSDLLQEAFNPMMEGQNV
jgi:hypothetical protein